MEKHAYLIIAHNEFDVLQKICYAIDDERNDIFIHFDRKVSHLPNVVCSKSNVCILKKPQRVKVSWGTFSQISATLALLEAAGNKYSRYHILSGTTMPLKSQDYIHSYFDKYSEFEVLKFMSGTKDEAYFKLRRYHYFVETKTSTITQKIKHILWLCCISMQNILHISRNKGVYFQKASQWCSITSKAAAYLLANKKAIMRRYNHTFCPDEYFVRTELSKKENGFNIMDSANYLAADFERTGPICYTEKDYARLIESEFIFARKFSEKNIAVVDKILEHIRIGQQL